MIAPRLEIDLDKIGHNARFLVRAMANRGISVTGVTKAMLGSPDIGGVLVCAGVSALGDSRVENIEAMRSAGMTAPMTLIRTPMLSQAAAVVASVDLSLNTELDVISALSTAAKKAETTHGVLFMVELGDLREGIMPGDLDKIVRETLRFPNISFEGIGTNLACRNGVVPDARNMGELSLLADRIDKSFGPIVKVVSGGNSANVPWVLSGADTGRINNLRLGEALLLGREPIFREPIDGLHTDAIVLVAEVIEAKVKPTMPSGDVGQSAFADAVVAVDHGHIWQTILAVGRQDIDPSGIQPPHGFEVLAASSDHLIVGSNNRQTSVGSEISFQLNYSALLRAMTSSFVTKAYSGVAKVDDSDRENVSARNGAPELHRHREPFTATSYRE
jgi:predicted amino acid racemase